MQEIEEVEKESTFFIVRMAHVSITSLDCLPINILLDFLCKGKVLGKENVTIFKKFVAKMEQFMKEYI